MRLLFCFLPSILAASLVAAEEPRVLPPLLSRGALCGPIVPCARSGDVAAHLRWTIPIWDLGLHLKPAVQFSMSASLWSWAELGASWYGELVLAPTDFLQGPITLWARLSPPLLSALGSDYPKEGLFLAAQVEHASGSAPFNQGEQLVPDAQTFTALAEWRKGRVMATAAAGLQLAGNARYRGLDVGAALWLQVLRSLGLQIGVEARGRIGAWPEEKSALRTDWTAAVLLAGLDDDGFEGGIGAVVRPSPEGPRPGLLMHGGWSVGRAYKRPAHDPTYPPLLPDLTTWWADRQAARRATASAQDFRLAHLRQLERLSGPASVCQLAPALLPWQVLRGCVVAGARFEYSPQSGDVLAETSTAPADQEQRRLDALAKVYLQQLGPTSGWTWAEAAKLCLRMAATAADGLNQFPAPIWCAAGVRIRSRTTAPSAAEHATPPTVRWVPEHAAMKPDAAQYQAGAAGARAGEAPALPRPGASRPVRFDGVDGAVLVDRKLRVVTTPKAEAQAVRQSAALKAAGQRGRWEVSTAYEARRAQALFDRLGITNIDVIVVRPE